MIVMLVFLLCFAVSFAVVYLMLTRAHDAPMTAADVFLASVSR